MIFFKPMTSEAEWKWFKSKTSVILCEDTQGIMAYKDGEIVAATVADSFTVDSCCVHMAIDSPMVIRHGFLHEVARHLYNDCGRSRLFGLVPSNNRRALKLDKHIGFTEVARIPNAIASGVDYVVMVMEKADCKWLEPFRVKEAA